MSSDRQKDYRNNKRFQRQQNNNERDRSGRKYDDKNKNHNDQRDRNYNNHRDRKHNNSNWDNRDKNQGHHRDRNQSNYKDKGYHRHDYKHQNYNDRQKNYRNSYNNYEKRLPPQNIIKVTSQNLQLPTIKIISENRKFNGKFKQKITKQNDVPLKLDQNRLGQLKNKITPIEKLWTNYIKQYLNISQFVQIFRYNKSLAYGRTQYGKSIINYRLKNQTMVYDNSTDQQQVFSRAYFKLWEILCLGVLQKYKNKPITFGCVAEGPGGFIHALIDFRQKQHKDEKDKPKDIYHSITLKIDENTRNAKDWSDKRGSTLFNKLRNFDYKINLSYGKDQTGNLLLNENIEHFANSINGKCLLVTGDGGIQCIGDRQFQYQQVFNAKLFLGEIISALHIQEITGSFILKIYDCSFKLSRQLLLLLALYYQNVKFVKPITSRPGNSQKYILCQNFIGITQQELNDLKQILLKWTEIEPNLSYFQNKQFVHNLFQFQCQNQQQILNNIHEANEFFMKQQQLMLEKGLQLAQSAKDSLDIDDQTKKKRYQQQINFAYGWCKKYNISSIKVIESIKKTTQKMQQQKKQQSKKPEDSIEMKNQQSVKATQSIPYQKNN